MNCEMILKTQLSVCHDCFRGYQTAYKGIFISLLAFMYKKNNYFCVNRNKWVICYEGE